MARVAQGLEYFVDIEGVLGSNPSTRTPKIYKSVNPTPKKKNPEGGFIIFYLIAREDDPDKVMDKLPSEAHRKRLFHLVEQQ